MSSDISITGLANGTKGLYLSFMNDTTSTIVFEDQHSGSIQANRFYLPSSSIILQPKSMISLIYLSSTLVGLGWACLSHS